MTEEAVDGAYLDSLNPEQRSAVEHFEGPLLVLAGAGSGKTRVLTARIAHLVHHHGVSPDRILAVTFTNKAAGEMRERVRGLLGAEPVGMWLGTFHALGARLLRRHADLLGWTHAFTIYDADQSLRQIKAIQDELDIDPRRWSPKAIRGQVSGAKNNLTSPQELEEASEGSFDLFARNVARVYPAYQGALKNQNAFDFDDLLVKPVELFQANELLLERYRSRFNFILVDEYQDTNRAQFVFLELLSRGQENLMVVGDDDQSIYGWRGADIRNILDFESTYPGAKTIRLERNYRSTEIILEAANHVIAENVRRKGKTLRTERVGGEKVSRVETLDETDEGRWIVAEIQRRYENGPDLHQYRDFAVLYRTNAQSRALEDAFRRAGIPYQIVGGVRFYERREIQDVLGYLRLISNPKDLVAFARVVNYPRRGVGPTSGDRLKAFAGGRGEGLLEAAAAASLCGGISRRAAGSLEAFAGLIQRYSVRAAQTSVGQLLDELIEELDLLRHLRDEGPDGEDRAENVKELIAGALDFDSGSMGDWEEEELDRFTELDLFLQQMALAGDIDKLDSEADSVTLMTLHNAKGLEFPVVFIAGLEDGLFPLSRAYDDPAEMEEERRLFYVGITRSEDKLYLTYAQRRRRAGEYMFGRLSPFAEAIPDELVEKNRSERFRRTSEYSLPYRLHPGGEDYATSPDLDDDAFNQDAPRFVKGERILHPTFGSGSVLEISGFGRDTRVTVDFDSVGRKKLVVRYAGLEKDWDI